jgi:hypothetical protein
MATDRVSVILPDDLVREIDRREKDRTKFVAEAVRRELDRRRRDELHRSLESRDTVNMAEEGFEEWSRGLPVEEAESLVDPAAGTPVRWIPGEGWAEDRA